MLQDQVIPPRRGGEARKRECHRCGLDFASTWAGDRICPACRRAEDDLARHNVVFMLREAYKL